MDNDKRLIEGVRAYALKHYNDGWDVVVEAWEDADILAHAQGATTVEEAIRLIAPGVSEFDDYRQDIESEADHG